MTNGIIIIHKEQNYTSADVVALLRGMFGQRKIGHTGTLDPNATGVLPVCLGSATRLCDMLTDQTKEYRAVLEFGKTSDTQDIWGTVEELTEASWKTLTAEQIAEAAASFLGTYEQLPPMYSAVKIGGKRLYELARAGVEVERKKRKVTIHEIEVLRVDLPVAELRIRCSKGTYIRTLIADLGEKLGCGAVMTGLVRTATGGFSLDQAYTLGQVQEMKDTGRLQETVLPVDSVFMQYPALVIKPAHQDRLYNGNFLYEHQVTLPDGSKFKHADIEVQERAASDENAGSAASSDQNVTSGLSSDTEHYRVYDAEQRFCGIYDWNATHHNLHVCKMFIPM